MEDTNQFATVHKEYNEDDEEVEYSDETRFADIYGNEIV